MLNHTIAFFPTRSHPAELSMRVFTGVLGRGTRVGLTNALMTGLTAARYPHHKQHEED